MTKKKLMRKTATTTTATTAGTEVLPKAAWRKIDPERAEEMLKLLTSNRKLVSNHVSFLAREMKEGRWKVNGDTIRFSPKRLLDGQHRLHAIIQSGVTIWVLVVEELPDDVFDSIDTGRTRGAGDIISTLGYGTNPFMIAAAGRFLWYYDHGMNLDSAIRISNHEIVEIVRKNPIISFVADYLANKKTMRASSIVAALTLISRKAGREMTMFFAEKLVVGAELHADDPIKYFRDKWLMESTHRSSRGDRAVWIAVCIKTYNAWLAKKKVERVERWNANEAFPEVAKEV
jgi:hypothetical protein